MKMDKLTRLRGMLLITLVGLVAIIWMLIFTGSLQFPKLRKRQTSPVMKYIRLLDANNGCILQYNSIEHRPRVVSPGVPESGIFSTDSTNVYLRLKEYMAFKTVHNLLQLPNPNTSSVMLENSRSVFDVGDEIRVKIQLKDGWNKDIKTGGDILRVWMSNDRLDASTSGYVIDHGNGSYTGVLKAFWKGKATIKTSIANTKEQVGIYMNYVMENGIWYHIYGYFKNSKSNKTEITKCTTIPNIKSYEEVCNFTERNYGISWYCGLPEDGNFRCEDWAYYSRAKSNTLLKSKLMREFLRNHKHMYLANPLSVTIIKGHLVSDPKFTCHERPKHLSWHDKTPVGFFFKNTWHSLNCKNILPPEGVILRDCLRNKSVILLGDSTTRQWFVYLTQQLKLVIDVGNWKKIKFSSYKKYSHALDRDLNISVSWSPHELPMYSDHKESVKDLHSVAAKLREIPTGSHAIVVLHWHFHTSRLPPYTYREHVKNARHEVELLLARAPNVNIFIKGPHAVVHVKNVEPHDFIQSLNFQILFEEFSGLHDRVIYLNEWDMTVACENGDIHPPEFIIKAMVHNLLSHVC